MSEKPAKKKLSRDPCVPPAAPKHITLALKALSHGNANEHQQRNALKWIVTDLCRTYDLSYRPSSDRDTVFAEGKRFVGLQIVQEINLPAALLSEEPR